MDDLPNLSKKPNPTQSDFLQIDKRTLPKAIQLTHAIRPMVFSYSFLLLAQSLLLVSI